MPSKHGWSEDSIAPESGIFVSEYDITAAPNDFNILTIFDFIESGAVIIPEFQRNYVWDINRASKFIESIIMNLPIPQIFLYGHPVVKILWLNKKASLDPQIQRHQVLSNYILYKELERALYQSDTPLSITKAIKQINKMYGVNMLIGENQSQIIHLKNNDAQQKILDAVTAIC